MIIDKEEPFKVIAKTCKCNKKEEQERNMKRKVTYLLADEYQSLCHDKKDIIVAELEACEQLLGHNDLENDDKSTVEREVIDLEMILCLLV
jgi:hypothetical protein